MKQCYRCGTCWQEEGPVCRICGADLTRTPSTPGPQPEQPSMPSVPPAPQMMPVQRYPGPLSFRKQKPFTQADLCTVLGFTSAVMGCFWGSVLLLPLGLVTSVLGYRRDRTKGLAVAGIVISVIGLLIKVVNILSQAVYLPPWYTNGIW